MSGKLKTRQTNKDGELPVSQSDLALWGGRLQEQISELKEGQGKLEKGQSKLEKGQSKLEKLVIQQAEQTRRYFDVVAENIHLDVSGANADEIKLIKDKQQIHEQQINELQQRVGLS